MSGISQLEKMTDIFAQCRMLLFVFWPIDFPQGKFDAKAENKKRWSISLKRIALFILVMTRIFFLSMAAARKPLLS